MKAGESIQEQFERFDHAYPEIYPKMHASLEAVCHIFALCVLSFDGTPALFKFIEIGSADAIVVFAVTSQIHRWKFLLLYPLIDALFVNLQFTGDLFNGEFDRRFSHRIAPQRESSRKIAHEEVA